MKYLLIIFLAISFDALAVKNTPSNLTIGSADLVTCSDGSKRTHCDTSIKKVNVTCTEPTQREDSAALSSSEISHYLFRARNQTDYIVVSKRASSCSFSVELKNGTWSIQMKTVLTDGLQSDFSSSLDFVINP